MIHGPIHNAYSLSFNQYAFFYVESDDDKKLVFDLKKMIDEKKKCFNSSFSTVLLTFWGYSWLLFLLLPYLKY